MSGLFKEEIIRCPKCGNVEFEKKELTGFEVIERTDGSKIYREVQPTMNIMCSKCGNKLFSINKLHNSYLEQDINI